MYLDTLASGALSQTVGIGYQVFSLERDFEVWGEVKHMLVDPNSPEIYEGVLAYKENYEARTSEVFTCNLEQEWPGRDGLIKAHYSSGFHLWIHENDAEQYLYWMKIIQIKEPNMLVLRKVQYTNASAEGYIDDCRVVVAATIRISVPERKTSAFDRYGVVGEHLLY